MVVVLGLDDGDRIIGLVIEDVICALGLAAGDELSSDDDASLGKVDLLAHLHHPVPACALYCGPMNLEQISHSLRSFLFIDSMVVCQGVPLRHVKTGQWIIRPTQHLCITF